MKPSCSPPGIDSVAGVYLACNTFSRKFLGLRGSSGYLVATALPGIAAPVGQLNVAVRVGAALTNGNDVVEGGATRVVATEHGIDLFPADLTDPAIALKHVPVIDLVPALSGYPDRRGAPARSCPSVPEPHIVSGTGYRIVVSQLGETLITKAVPSGMEHPRGHPAVGVERVGPTATALRTEGADWSFCHGVDFPPDSS